jgi:hypothetical protein
MSLHPDHLADLRKSGLSDDTIAAMLVYSMSPAELMHFLGNAAPGIESAMAFPYFDAAGNKNGFTRIKIFPPLKDAKGHTIKYLQKKNSSPHLYILPAVAELLGEAKIPLYIVEGEKKTAKAVEIGLAAIGIAGVWNWLQHGSHQAIDEFESINLWRRQVVIVPDNDTWNDEKKSENIRRAVYYLSRELKARGASVKFLIIGA